MDDKNSGSNFGYGLFKVLAYLIVLLVVGVSMYFMADGNPAIFIAGMLAFFVLVFILDKWLTIPKSK